ncbi:toll/interleukin-1 receptor domain-containing protein, partial [Streptococcus pneumoniae]|nr:toll/interleukin-1 receptor domain-containing protein [Streptococcus pneumoniae]MDG9321120.1 toll/interleukin-1 receptor domain-containing protein [Streptococcus pneumoniae]
MNKPTVFFSHSSLDKEIAKSLKDKLIEYTGGTVQIFVSSDGESIPFGKNWLSTIERGLEESRIMFLLVTPNSIDLFGNCKKCYTIFMETVYDKAQKLN